jgi:hypothetical protein
MAILASPSQQRPPCGSEPIWHYLKERDKREMRTLLFLLLLLPDLPLTAAYAQTQPPPFQCTGDGRDYCSVRYSEAIITSPDPSRPSLRAQVEQRVSMGSGTDTHYYITNAATGDLLFDYVATGTCCALYVRNGNELLVSYVHGGVSEQTTYRMNAAGVFVAVTAQSALEPVSADDVSRISHDLERLGWRELGP